MSVREAAMALLHQIDIGDFVDSHGHDAKMLRAVHALRAALARADAAEADARRYAWLRMNRLWLKANLPLLAAIELDAAIDAAIVQEQL